MQNADIVLPFTPIFDKDKLFCRKQILERLTRKLRFHKNMILFGESGVGKSSLLYAGLTPVLQNMSMFPVFVSLGDEEYIEEDIRNSICSTCHQFDIKYDNLDFHNITEFLLFSRFTDPETNLPVTPLIILDQFERYSEQSQSFFDRFWEIVRSIEDCANFLFCINTDHISLLGDFVNETGGVELLYLSPFSYDEICEVTTKLFPSLSLDERENILKNYESVDFIKPAHYIVDMHYYDATLGDGNIYNNILKYYEDNTSMLSTKARREMERCLIGKEGTIHFMCIDDILSNTGLHKEDIQHLIDNGILKVVYYHERRYCSVNGIFVEEFYKRRRICFDKYVNILNKVRKRLLRLHKQ